MECACSQALVFGSVSPKAATQAFLKTSIWGRAGVGSGEKPQGNEQLLPTYKRFATTEFRSTACFGLRP